MLEKCCSGLVLGGIWQAGTNHTKHFQPENLFPGSPYAGFKRDLQTQEKQDTQCLVSRHFGITILTSDIPKICILKGRCKSLNNFAFKCSPSENLFLKSPIHMEDAARNVLLYTHYSVTLNMTINKCLPPTGPLPETPA